MAHMLELFLRDDISLDDQSDFESDATEPDDADLRSDPFASRNGAPHFDEEDQA
jgi:hypothetical protein